MAEIILPIVVEVVKCLAHPACREISYLRESKYTTNLQNLKAEVDNLKSERDSTEHQVEEAKRKGEGIEENVANWLATANSIIEKANNVIEEANKFTADEAAANKRCFKGLCPNLRTRRRLSKEAERQKEAVVKVREDRKFVRISSRTAPEDIRLIPNKDYEPFESRMSTLGSILSALEDRDVNMLGIYGMGGIGKTTLAEEVARKVKSDKLFDQVVFVEVSHKQDIRKIQGVIADKLGLELHEESDEGRVGRLCEGIKKVKKILIVLDNIWENLNLGNVGIPLGDGCKVLLTTRNLNVLSVMMDCRTNFAVGVLEKEEAWSLFKKMAGDYVEGSELEEVARNVAEECAGLPVSIVTVARALRNKRISEWKHAREQLKRPLSNFNDVQQAAFKAIELCYNNLGRDDLKNIFLLIGYTAIASIDDLLMCGMGLGLFQGVNKIEVARNGVHTLVRTLKDSCMLLDHESKNEELFSMAAVVRNVAISIAHKEQIALIATNEHDDGFREWSDESAVKRYASIVLHDIKTNMLPEVVECPQLKLLFIRADRGGSSLTMPNNFFERMIEVRVLNLTSMTLQSLPSSLGLLSNLRTLSLCRCFLLDISFVGYLKKLEILCLRGSMIEKLPVEVGELTWLKLLDLRDCWELKVIPPNILKKLSHLEELYISRGKFDKWEVEVEGAEHASLEELKHLPNLTSLELDIHDVSTLPRGLFLEKLERYSIRIGDHENRKSNGIWCREFSLEVNNKICLKDSLIVQLQRIEDLELSGLQEQDVDYFRNELFNVGSSYLKRLEMRGSSLALNLAESKRQEESANGLQSHEIILEDNVQISNTLFPEKVRLPELEKLMLYSINVERIWLSQVTVMSCGIQNLMHLTLRSCMNLRYLFSSSIVSSFVRLQRIEIVECPVLKELIVMDNQEERKNNNGCDHLVDLVPSSTSFQNLTNLVVSCCKGLKIVLTFSIAKTLVRLEYMEIESCDRITEIVLVDDVAAKDEVITFRELKELKLLNLESLTSFCSGNCAFKFPSLERLVLDDCPSMKIFSEGNSSTPKLHEVQWPGEARWAWKDDLNTTIQKVIFPAMVAGVWSDDGGLEEDGDTEKEDEHKAVTTSSNY
ncbi:putative disease resistance protein [Citrus sinensis]|nr:putative disease resistance protein [Citrus sinensis]